MTTEEDIQSLEKLISRMEASVADPKRFGALDLDFHLALAKASENYLLLDLVSMIRGQLARAVTKMMLLPGELPISVREHLSMLSCSAVLMSISAVNAGAKMHRRTGVKMHHDGPAAGAQLSKSI